MSDLHLPFSDAFGEPPIGSRDIPDTDDQFGVELRSGRLGIAVNGRLHVAELSAERMLALGAALTVAGMVAGGDQDVALSMLSSKTRAALEAITGRRLFFPEAGGDTKVRTDA